MYNDLVNQDLVSAARAKRDAVIARRGPAQELLEAANKALPAAEARHNAALSGESNEDPHVTAAALATARQAVVTATEAPVAVETAIVRAAEVCEREIGVAHQEAARAAGKGMYQATVEAAAARAALAKAEASFRENHAAVARYRGLRAGFGEANPSYSSHSWDSQTGMV